VTSLLWPVVQEYVKISVLQQQNQPVPYKAKFTYVLVVPNPATYTGVGLQ